MATDRGSSNCALDQVPPTDLLLVGWLVDWFVVVGMNFGFKRRRIWVREEVRWAHDNGSYIFKKQVENLTKIDE